MGSGADPLGLAWTYARPSMFLTCNGRFGGEGAISVDQA